MLGMTPHKSECSTQAAATDRTYQCDAECGVDIAHGLRAEDFEAVVPGRSAAAFQALASIAGLERNRGRVLPETDQKLGDHPQALRPRGPAVGVSQRAHDLPLL